MGALPQIVGGLFYTPGHFARAETEFRWSIKQNPDYWRSAVLYVDKESAERVRRHFSQFGEVVVDEHLPEPVDRRRRWNCKGWWARKAVERFGRILYSDFDIYVRRPIDETVAARLVRSPMFLDIPTYRDPHKLVGCGITYYDEHADWASFFDFLYNKWGDDERAWTDALQMTYEKLRANGWTMSPYIVDHTWVRMNPERRLEPYVIHGISPLDDGRGVLRRLGYAGGEIRFHTTVSHEVRELGRRVRGRLGVMRRRLLGTEKPVAPGGD
jgi:hypothetical protein